MNILANGYKTKNTVMEYINTNKQEKDMMEIGKMEKKVEMENSFLLKVIFTKDNLNKDTKMDLEESNTNQVPNLKEILLIIKHKAKVK